MDYRLALMTGIDIPIQELQVNIHQPTIKEISYIGEEEFFTALQYLNVNKRIYIKDQQVINQISNFEIFITLINQNDLKNVKNYINNLFSLLFPEYKSMITPQTIILMNKERGTIIIDNNNFDILQEILKKIFCLNGSKEGENRTFNPQGKKAQEIADKIMKGRKKILEEKGEEHKSIFSKYLSILAIGNHQSLNDLINLTVFQIYDQVERYSMFVNWDIDIQSRMAGAKVDEKPYDWMKDIH